MTRQLILVTGAARCGKSEWAEKVASQMECPVIYIATAQADPSDQEWQLRIEKHQKRRPSTWKTLVIPQELTIAIKNASSSIVC
jgi:adenosylcobinamide kinase / adenosylcobinamide-phosphate guanylyltransferase